MSVADTKPKPIRIGVEGIAPKPIELTPERLRIDWASLFSLPAFQMFMAERHAGATVDSVPPTQGLYDEYCCWHSDRGYWPNEDPMGRIIK